jgi:hypothetical protein
MDDPASNDLAQNSTRAPSSPMTPRSWRLLSKGAAGASWFGSPVTAELPLDNNCSSDQETKSNWHQDWGYQPLSQIDLLAGGHITARRVAGVQDSLGHR